MISLASKHRLDEDQTGSTRPNHGLVVYVKDGIPVTRLHSHKFDGIEIIIIQAEIKQTEIQVVFLYKTPKLGQQQFIKTLTDSIQPYVGRNKPLFILGDFNINLIDRPNMITQYMEDKHSCRQIISEPTTCYKTLLDHVYTNETNVQAGVIPAYWSDHCLIFCIKQ